MKNNPSIEELQTSDKYELIAELNHKSVKQFVLAQLNQRNWAIKTYMIYQILMFIFGAFILTCGVIFAIKNIFMPGIYVLAGLLFSFSALVIIHELLHGLAIKIAGAPKVSYGAYLRQFVFYAEADRFVFNKKQFALVALAPLVVIKLMCVTGIILFFHHPIVFLVAIIMSVHSFFCAGDIALLSVFLRHETPVYTFDIADQKQSFYYKKLL